jgi:spore germination protein GerM
MKILKDCRILPSLILRIFVFIPLICLIILSFSGCSLLNSGSGSTVKSDIATTNQVSETSGSESSQENTVSTDTQATEVETTISATTETQEQWTEINIKAYYVDDQAQYLIGEDRTITGKTKEDFIIAAFNELIKEPVRKDIFNVIPKGTSIINAEYIDNYAFLNLSPEFLNNKDNSGLVDNLVLNCIADTVTEIPDIQGIIIKVNWEKIKSYGSIDVSNPIKRNTEIIKH